MEWFGGIKSRMKMSQAAVVVQNLLEPMARSGLLDGNAADLANHLVGAVWQQDPDMFGGIHGKPPHKLAVAAAALANGYRFSGARPALKGAVTVALAEILKEVSQRGMLYPFHDLDMALFSKAEKALLAHDQSNRLGLEQEAEEAAYKRAFLLVDPRAKEVAAKAAATLDLQFFLCRLTPGFLTTLQSDEVRGYFVGFLDGAAQHAALELPSDEQFFSYVGHGLMCLLRNDLDDAAGYALDALARKGTDGFERGQALGGREYFSWANDGSPPSGLVRAFEAN